MQPFTFSYKKLTVKTGKVEKSLITWMNKMYLFLSKKFKKSEKNKFKILDKDYRLCFTNEIEIDLSQYVE